MRSLYIRQGELYLKPSRQDLGQIQLLSEALVKIISFLITQNYLSTKFFQQDRVAFSTCTAASLLANVSGTEVPRATKVMAFTVSFRLMQQPSWLAMSPMTAVTMPMVPMETKKQRQPLKKPFWCQKNRQMSFTFFNSKKIIGQFDLIARFQLQALV